MTNRRQFLQIGITATAWPIASTAIGASGAELGRTVPIYKAICDTRFPDSRKFGESAAHLGIPVQAIDGDMTKFWYDELYHVWNNTPMAIAGLTAHGPMFCFEQLAHDKRLRVVFRAEHAAQGHSGIAHALEGPASMLSACAGIDRSGQGWSSRMAEVIASCPSGRSEILHSRASSPHSPAQFGHDAEALYTWLIAPAVDA